MRYLWEVKVRTHRKTLDTAYPANVYTLGLYHQGPAPPAPLLQLYTRAAVLTPWPITKFISLQGDRGTCWQSHLMNRYPVVRIQHTHSHPKEIYETFQTLGFCPVPTLWSAQDTNTHTVKVLTLPTTLPPPWLWDRAAPYHPGLIRREPLQDTDFIINETAEPRHRHHNPANLHLFLSSILSLESWNILRTTFVHLVSCCTQKCWPDSRFIKIKPCSALPTCWPSTMDSWCRHLSHVLPLLLTYMVVTTLSSVPWLLFMPVGTLLWSP